MQEKFREDEKRSFETNCDNAEEVLEKVLMELRPLAAQGESQHTPPVNVLGSLSDAADQSPASLFVTLEALHLKHMVVGPRILSVEHCRFFLSGCWRGKDCRFSHLTSESQAINAKLFMALLGMGLFTRASQKAGRVAESALSQNDIYIYIYI